MNTGSMDILDLLEFRPNEGSILLGRERLLIHSANALGALRKNLIKSFGTEAAKQVLTRFAYAQGYEHGLILARKFGSKQAVALGPLVHEMEGVGIPTLLVKIHDPDGPSFHEVAVCHNSIEAEQFLLESGHSEIPVCWMYPAFASGYQSAVRQEPVYFREVMCIAQDHPCCRIEGRNIEGWKESRKTGDTWAEAVEEDFDPFLELRSEIEQRIRSRYGSREWEQTVRADRDHVQTEDNEWTSPVVIPGLEKFIVSNREMAAAIHQATQVAPTDFSVLVSGESGTGKEFFARLIHEKSGRTKSPFVSLNCAALTETLLESELFGHVRGSFTGAYRDKMGLLELARDGTLFLDEVGDMPLGIQAKLLRALESRKIRRVGDEIDRSVLARIVAATNCDLQAAISERRFRKDLYFRLAGFVISLPPLRDRRDAIPSLVQEFVSKASQACNKQVKSFGRDAMKALLEYDWPGNVRELKHVVQRAVIVASSEQIEVGDLPSEIRHRAPRIVSSTSIPNINEPDQIRRALERHGGNRAATARYLRISTVTLWRKMKRYNLNV